MPFIPPINPNLDIAADVTDFAKWIARGLKDAAAYLGRPLNTHEAEEERKRLATLYWRTRKDTPTPNGK